MKDHLRLKNEIYDPFKGKVIDWMEENEYGGWNIHFTDGIYLCLDVAMHKSYEVRKITSYPPEE